MRNRSHVKMFFILTISFIVFSIFSILIQLFAFYPAAIFFSYESSISYNQTSICKKCEKDTITERMNEDFIQKNKLKESVTQHKVEQTLIRSVSPTIFILLGTLGFVYLLKKNKQKFVPIDFSLKKWIAIFLSLFWLRELFLLLIYLFSLIMKKEDLLIINEINIAETIAVSPLLILLPLGLIAIFISYTVVFIFIPKAQRSVFIFAQLLGCITGVLLWFRIIGPFLLPN